MEEKGMKETFSVSPGTNKVYSGGKSRLLCYAAIAALAVATIVVVGLALGLGLGLGLSDDDESSATDRSSATYNTAAVATDAAPCSTVGVEILRKGGSAVDAAIASLLCLGVVNFHSTGIGGGGFMVYYNATSKTATTLDYRETAPGRANSSMYESRIASLYGGLAIAVPGELRGLELAHKKYGKLSWQELFEPAAKIADEGFEVSRTIASAINAGFIKRRVEEGNYTVLKELIAPGDDWLQEGATIYRKKYAETLRKIGESGNADYFYEGEFMQQMVQELKEAGAIIEEEDFLNYTAIEREPLESYYDDLKVIGTSAPGGGAVLSLALNILQGYEFNGGDFDSLTYHRLVESFKFALGQRLLLGDPAFNDTVDEVVNFMLNTSTADYMRSRIQDSTTQNSSYYQEPTVFSIPSDFGTSHLSVLASNGDAVAATGTVNSFFGSLVRSSTNGIIFNDEMDDFSIPAEGDSGPPAVPNLIGPGKRMQSSTAPTIILDGDKVKMVVGASGGSRIPSAVAQVILDVLNYDKKLSSAISLPRLQPRLYPNSIRVETDFPEEYREGLEERNHELVQSSGTAVVQGIFVEDGEIQATSDPRKGGEPDGY